VHDANVLYLEWENNHVWDVLFHAGRYFTLDYLCATREGLGFGGCGKSVLKHIYEEDRIRDAHRHGVSPEYVITCEDYTDELFRREAARHYAEVTRVSPYIAERYCETPHWLNRLQTWRNVCS